jgi:hypothetical protein
MIFLRRARAVVPYIYIYRHIPHRRECAPTSAHTHARLYTFYTHQSREILFFLCVRAILDSLSKSARERPATYSLRFDHGLPATV